MQTQPGLLLNSQKIHADAARSFGFVILEVMRDQLNVNLPARMQVRGRLAAQPAGQQISLKMLWFDHFRVS